MTIGEPDQAHEIIKLNLPDRPRFSRECVEFYKNGMSLHEIARLTGRSRDAIRRALRKAGFSTRPPIDESKVTRWRKGNRSTGHAPFGYAYFMGQLVIEPREHEILLLIGQLVKDEMNPNAIAEHLNQKGLKPRRAKLWRRTAIVLILYRMRHSPPHS